MGTLGPLPECRGCDCDSRKPSCHELAPGPVDGVWGDRPPATTAPSCNWPPNCWGSNFNSKLSPLFCLTCDGDRRARGARCFPSRCANRCRVAGLSDNGVLSVKPPQITGIGVKPCVLLHLQFGIQLARGAISLPKSKNVANKGLTRQFLRSSGAPSSFSMSC